MLLAVVHHVELVPELERHGSPFAEVAPCPSLLAVLEAPLACLEDRQAKQSAVPHALEL